MQFCIFTLKKLSDSSRLFGVEVSDNILINSIIRSIGMRKIQMVDLKGQYAAIKERVNASIQEVIDTTAFINGPQVQEFQKELETYLGVKHVIPCANGTDALQVAMMSLNLQPGDEIITADFTFAATVEVIALLQLTPVLVDVDPINFNIDIAAIEKAITPKTKMVFFNSPNNPSGTIYTEEEYRALAKVLEKHPQIYILSDEIYEHINYGIKSFSFAAIENMFDRTITVNGLAKAFAMTGWRIGYIGAPDWVAKACTKMQGQITSGTNCIAQRAAITAVLAPVEKVQYMVDEFKSRRDIVLNLLGKVEGFKLNIPDGAFYVFPDISYFFGKTIKGKTINNANDFSLFLLEEANVATVTGDAFGAPNCIRISYAASEDLLRKAIDRIQKAIQS